MSFLDNYREYANTSKRDLLDVLNNCWQFDSPTGNLQVAILNKQTGQHSRWVDWFDIRDNPWWVEKVNNRLIGIPELVFDLDPALSETSEQTKMKIPKFAKLINQDPEVTFLAGYSTGSRGYHLHFMINDFWKYRPPTLTKIKRYLLEKYKSDIGKAVPRSMIAIEGCPHWKTGNPKKVIDCG